MRSTSARMKGTFAFGAAVNKAKIAKKSFESEKPKII